MHFFMHTTMAHIIFCLEASVYVHNNGSEHVCSSPKATIARMRCTSSTMDMCTIDLRWTGLQQGLAKSREV